jgi:surface carbohydrate biosynthesis protein (TIGR04326 family)
MEKSNTLVIWDSKDKPSLEYNHLMLWDSYESQETDGLFSISEIVEKNAEKLRFEYLEAIFKLGEHWVNEKKIVEHLEIRPDFSYWWMTLMNEKCNFSKSPEIVNIIKIFALKDWIKKNNYQNISLITSNENLANAMGILCNQSGLKYDFKKSNKQKIRLSFIEVLYHKLPYCLKALLWFSTHLTSHWALKGVGVDKWKNTKGKVTFISYLFNLNSKDKEKGIFESSYWASLPNKLKENEIETNWLHIYIKDKLVPNSSEAKKTIGQFNKSHTGEQIHVTLHSFLSFRLVFRVLKDWFTLVFIQRNFKNSFIKNSNFLWPLIKNDYFNSFIGSTAINNLLFLNLFHEAMEALPRQEKGIFLQENQSWEYGLIYFWKNFRHADDLVGVTSFPPRFWDLRFYFDSRCYSQNVKCKLPMPNYVGVNGENAKKLSLDCGYPKKNIIELEALRYLYLNDIKPISKVTNSDCLNILVLGDYQKENTNHQMNLLQAAFTHIAQEIKIVVKPHPSCDILPSNYPELDLLVTSEPVSKLLDDFSVVYSSSSTSASIDAYYSGKFVLVALNSSSLNFSPLRGIDGTLFVETAQQLADALNKFNEFPNKMSHDKNYFYLNPDLPRWKEFLFNPDKIKNKSKMEEA